MFEKQNKFYEAVGICNSFARMSREDREFFFEAREKLNQRCERYLAVKTLLGDKITDELSQKIERRLEMNAKAYRVLKALLKDASDKEIFEETRGIVFSFENGEANVLLRELTEMERYYRFPSIGGNLDCGQLDTANAPIIHSINGGEHVCHSANPSASSEIRYRCGNMFSIVQKMKKEGNG